MAHKKQPPLVQPPKIVDLIPAWQHMLRGQQLVESTVVNYGRIMTRFAHWLDPDDAAPGDIVTDLIEQYRGDLAALGQKPKTISLALSAIRRFCRWCVLTRRLGSDPTEGIEWPKLGHHVPRALSPQEMDSLFMAIAAPRANDKKNVRLWRRNRRLVFLLLFAALRISEAAALDWSHVDLEAGVLTVYDGKGGKDRVVPLADALQAELECVPPAERQGAVCGQKYGDPVGPKGLAHFFERDLPAQGVTGVSAHRLRHSGATEMRKGGADLMDIQQILGHSSLDTTRIYMGPDPEKLRSAVNRIPSQPRAARGRHQSPALRLVK